jgi:ABC-2 type transport system permease protein
MRLFISGLRKLSTRMATLLTFGLLAGLLVMIDLAVAATGGGTGEEGENALLLVTFPGAYDLILSFMFGLGGLFAVIYGAAIAGSEWTWGTLKTSVVRGESRSRYLLTTFAAIALVLAVGLLITFVIGVGGAALGSVIAGISLEGIGDTATLSGLPELFARGWVAITATAALGFAVATLARSQLAGIGVGIAFYFAETFAGIFLPDVVRYMPFHLSQAAVGGASDFGGAPDPAALSVGTALLLVTVWLVGSLAVAAGFSERAEITG